jgi:transposase-like protein
MTDNAGCYTPVLRAALPEATHRTAKYRNNGLERDHGHLKQQVRPMGGFKSLAAANIFSRGHALIQNLGNGFSALTEVIPPAAPFTRHVASAGTGDRAAGGAPPRRR